MEQSSEDEVAAILLELEKLIYRFPLTWGAKRRRSAIASYSSSESLPPPPPPLPKPKAVSPATPLSFPPSDEYNESDDNPTRTKRNNVSIKRKREHCLEVMEELTKANNLLHGEVENVKSYFERLKDYNLKLKERKQELGSVGRSQDDTVHKQQLRLKLPGTAQHVSLIANRTTMPPPMSGVGGRATTSLGVTSSSGCGLGMTNANSYDVGPTGIPDLNVPLEEPVVTEDFTEGLDNKNVSRAMAAEARKNRRQIHRLKNQIPRK